MFFSQMFKSASSNKRVFSGGSGGSTSSSGSQVDEKTAMGNSAFNRAVTLKATNLAQLPCNLYKRKGEHREKAVDHPLFSALRYQPNKKDSQFEYFESASGFLSIKGNHYALMERDSKMRVIELIPVHPDNVKVLKGTDGLPYYHLITENKIVGMDVMHHIKGFSFNGFTGMSQIEMAPEAIGLALATEQHASAVFSQGTTLSGVLERPQTEHVKALDTQQEIDNIVTSFMARHSGGVRNAFKVALLQEGMTYKQMAMTNNDAQMVEARRMGVLDIARLFGIPPVMLGEAAGESYKSVEQTTLNFLIFCLMPDLKRAESAMNRDLLLPEERKDYFIEFNFSSLVRGDFKTRYESYAIGRQWGFLSANDIRRFENMAPIPGGDEYLTPMNMIDASTQASAEKMTQANAEQLQQIEKILCRT